MLMLLPLGAKADTYVSTFTGFSATNNSLVASETTIDGAVVRNWTVSAGAAEYSDGVAIIEAPQSAEIGEIILNTDFWVYGSIQYIEIEGTCAEESTFRLKDANDQQGGYISEAIEPYIENSKIHLYIGEENDVSDPRQLSLVYTGNSLEISKITIVTSRISIYNGGCIPIYYDEDNQGMAYDNMIQFNPVDTILVINDLGELYGEQGPVIFTSYPHLTIQFLGNVTLCSKTKFITVNSPEGTQKLTFATDANNPGTLTFKNEYTVYTDGNEQVNTGDVTEAMMSFAATGSNYGVVVEYLDDLVQKATSESPIYYIISTDNVITPIINEGVPDRDIEIDGTDTDYDDLDGVVIDDVYYTLTSDEGYYDNSGGTKGVVVKVGMSDAEVEAAIKAGKPGTPAFDALFRGITMMVPAGIGTVTINAKGSAAGAVLKTKLGAAAAVAHNLTTDYADYVVNYQCTEATYLYIYVLDQEPATARPGGPHFGKVQTATVKMTGYKGNSAAVVNSVGGVQTASVYSLSCTGYKAGDDHVTMSTVEVAPAAVAAARPVGGPMLAAANPVSYPITSLADNLFEEITTENKVKLLYVDLSGTQVKGLYLDRDDGLFKGFSDQTSIYLPNDNSAEEDEPNVIINGECKTMTLDESKTFKAPAGKTFKVETVKLTRTNAFDAGKHATVFLPFTIPASQASTLGTFHTFKEISGDDAVFNTAETGDIAANTPYIFVPKSAGASLTATNVTLNTTVPPASGKLIGTFERIDWTTDPDDIYGFSATDQNGLTQGQFFKVKASSYILPFRAYLKVDAAPSRLRLVIGDDTTGITTISNPENEDNIWYSLDGQRHQGKPAKQGVYIHNNQKVLVK